MERVTKLIVLCRVTGDAHGFANVFRSTIQGPGYFRFSRWCGLCVKPRQESDGRDA
jgi:hypothetical protein